MTSPVSRSTRSALSSVPLSSGFVSTRLSMPTIGAWLAQLLMRAGSPAAAAGATETHQLPKFTPADESRAL